MFYVVNCTLCTNLHLGHMTNVAARWFIGLCKMAYAKWPCDKESANVYQENVNKF